MTPPTIIEQSSAAVAEGVRAMVWRKNVLLLSRGELGKLIGYSPDAVKRFERGMAANGRARLRYRRACAGLSRPTFDWT